MWICWHGVTCEYIDVVWHATCKYVDMVWHVNVFTWYDMWICRRSRSDTLKTRLRVDQTLNRSAGKKNTCMQRCWSLVQKMLKVPARYFSDLLSMSVSQCSEATSLGRDRNVCICFVSTHHITGMIHATMPRMLLIRQCQRILSSERLLEMCSSPAVQTAFVQHLGCLHQRPCWRCTAVQVM